MAGRIMQESRPFPMAASVSFCPPDDPRCARSSSHVTSISSVGSRIEDPAEPLLLAPKVGGALRFHLVPPKASKIEAQELMPRRGHGEARPCISVTIVGT